MKTILSVVLIAFLMMLSDVAGRHDTARNGTVTTSSRHVLYWVDPMHPDYRSDHPTPNSKPESPTGWRSRTAAGC
jgi:hypothetical protein